MPFLSHVGKKNRWRRRSYYAIKIRSGAAQKIHPGVIYDQKRRGEIYWIFWEQNLLGSPHLQTQLQAVPVLSSLYPSLISFSSFTFPGAPYRIFLLFLPWLPCQFYLVVIEQHQLLKSQNNKKYTYIFEIDFVSIHISLQLLKINGHHYV